MPSDLRARIWLEEEGFTDLLPLFEDNDVEFEVLKTMTEQDFKEIGVMSFGLRRKLTIAVKKLTGSQEGEEKEHQSVLDSSCDEESSTCSSIGSSQSAKTSSGSPLSKTSCEPGTSSSTSIASKKQKSCKECVQEHPQGKDILCRLEDGKHLTTLQRRLFVRIQTANLISKWGLYPTSAQKEKLARDIVQTFPTLKDTTPGMEGHEIFYHQGNGFIEYRLKTVRAGSPLSSKKRKHSVLEPGPSEEVEENSAGVIEKIHEMKYTPPSKENTKRIVALFKETHRHRRQWSLRTSVDITTFLQEYPRLQDMPQLIDVEFQMMYPDNHSGFLSKWECYYAPRILEIAKEEYPAIAAIISNFEGGDRNLCAAILLGHILYRCSSKKSQSVAASRAEAIKFFIQSVPIGTDIAEAAKKKDTKYQQPFLLGMGPETKPNQFFMVLDKLSVPAGEATVTAIDALFKAYYCFNVEFPVAMSQFWEFLACEVYCVMPKKNAKPQVRTLASALNSLAME